MTKISLRKYGFKNTPEDNFADDGNYFFTSYANINNCWVRSTICYNDCGQNLVFRDFRIENVNHKIKSKLPEDKRNLWYNIEREAKLDEFNGCSKTHYTPEAVANLMKRLDDATAILSNLID